MEMHSCFFKYVFTLSYSYATHTDTRTRTHLHSYAMLRSDRTIVSIWIWNHCCGFTWVKYKQHLKIECGWEEGACARIRSERNVMQFGACVCVCVWHFTKLNIKRWALKWHPLFAGITPIFKHFNPFYLSSHRNDMACSISESIHLQIFFSRSTLRIPVYVFDRPATVNRKLKWKTWAKGFITIEIATPENGFNLH